MSLVVGLDSYVTQIDATAYITANYATTDTVYIAWNALSTADKDARLRKALKVIDRQPLIGGKVVYTQALAFPRALPTDYHYTQIHPGIIGWGDGYYVQTTIPDAVKNAQVELALVLMTGTSSRLELQREGVKSFLVGNLREDYSIGRNNALPYEVKEMLKQYLATSIEIS